MFEKRIFLVDDLEFILNPVIRYLKKVGFKNISGITTANEALVRIENEKPDLIILDVQLEDTIDGVEILRRTKTLLSPNSIVVMLTANKEKNENQCRELGAFETWSKPLEPDVMIENIKRIFQNN